MKTQVMKGTYEGWSTFTVNTYIKKYYFGKRYIAINSLRIFLLALNKFSLSFLHSVEQFWSLLLWMSLVALSWLPKCSASIQNIYLPWSFWLWRGARSCRVPDAVYKVVRTHHNVFMCLSFCWMALSSSIHHIFITPHKGTRERGLLALPQKVARSTG